MADLTAIILTKNEEVNIRLCIKSIKDIVKRIIVIDSYSADSTVEIARSLGAEVYFHEFENYSKQFKYGLENFNINTKWVLRIDADESLTVSSASEIEDLCNQNMETDTNGIVVRFETVFMDKKLKFGGVYPFKKLIVFKYGIGDIEDKHMDEHIILSKGKTIETKYDSILRDFKGLTTFVNKHNWYASREAADYFDLNSSCSNADKLDRSSKMKHFFKTKIYYKLPFGTRAHLYFLYRYYFKLGFLDGKEGKICAFLEAYWYRFLVDAKIYEAKKRNGKPTYSKGLN